MGSELLNPYAYANLRNAVTVKSYAAKKVKKTFKKLK